MNVNPFKGKGEKLTVEGDIVLLYNHNILLLYSESTCTLELKDIFCSSFWNFHFYEIKSIHFSTLEQKLQLIHLAHGKFFISVH